MAENNNTENNKEIVVDVIDVKHEDEAKKRKKPYKGTSDVWEHYKKVLKPDGSSSGRANCKYCGKGLGAVSSQGTSTLWRHTNSCKLNPNRSSKDKKQPVLSFSNSDGETNISSWKFDQEACVDSLARMIMIDELPLNFVEHQGFRRFCNLMQPRFQHRSRPTIRKACTRLYLSEKQKLRKMFVETDQRVCITTDMWTSIQNLGYMCITAHYIDKDWKLHKKIINFRVVPTPHKGEYIGNAIELCLLSWGIDKLNTITVDNCSSNDVAVQSLKRKFIKKNGLLLNGEFFHMRCCAHILNLIVKDGVYEVRDEVQRIRSCVKFVKSSPSRLQRFNQCVEHEQISSNRSVCMDVPTRWNSTFFMLQSALEFQKAFDRLEEQDSQFQTEIGNEMPTDDDWETASHLCKFLEVFYKVTKRLSGYRYVTSNAYFHEVFSIEGLLDEWSKSETVSFSNMAEKMKLKFNKYWGNIDKINMLLIVAIVLDPCYKLEYVRFCFLKIHDETTVKGKIDKVKAVIVRLYEQYRSSVLLANSVDENKSQDKGSDSGSKFTFGKAANVKKAYRQFLQEQQGTLNKSELERYLGEEAESDDENFDVLNWWKLNQSKYRVLSHMARDILAIPMSTVASESAFSTGGRILDRFRSKLKPGFVENLVCGQDWFRVSAPLEEDEDFDDEEEVEIIEGNHAG